MNFPLPTQSSGVQEPLDLEEISRRKTQTNSRQLSTNTKQTSLGTWFSTKKRSMWFFSSKKKTSYFSTLGEAPPQSPTMQERPFSNNSLPIQSANVSPSHYIESIHASDLDRLTLLRNKNKKRVDNAATTASLAVFVGCLLFLVIVLSSLLGSDALCPSSNSIEDIVQDPVIDGCGSEEIDEDIRGLIARSFDAAIDDGVIAFNNLSLSCLPSTALRYLSVEQKESVFLAESLSFIGTGLVKISEQAFLEDEVESVKFLEFSESGLSALPDGLLFPFVSLEELVIERNAFVTLNNDIFGREFNLTRISFADSFGLVELPQILSNVKSLSTLDLRNCRSMLTFQEDLLVHLKDDNVIVELGNNRLIDDNSETDILIALGLL